MSDALAAYKLMARMRAFEEACREGVSTGEIHGELHISIGLEAIAAGMSPSLRTRDALVSTHRCHLHALAKGVSAEAVMLEVFEKEAGLCHGRGGHMHLFDPERLFSTTGIVGASLPVALGHAYAAKLSGTDNIAVGVTGDGGANNGTFHECLNIAGAWRLPLVILLENNGYAISVPVESVVPEGATFADRGAVYGAWSKRVDGTDVYAVRDAFAEACAHARAGRGPALLEAVAYRFSGHYEGDLDHYRTAEYKERMVAADPILRERSRLLASGEAEEQTLNEVDAQARTEFAEMLERVRTHPQPDPATVFDFALSP